MPLDPDSIEYKIEKYRTYIRDIIFEWYNDDLVSGVSLLSIREEVNKHTSLTIKTLTSVINDFESQGNWIYTSKLRDTIDNYLVSLGVRLKKLDGAILDPDCIIREYSQNRDI